MLNPLEPMRIDPESIEQILAACYRIARERAHQLRTQPQSEMTASSDAQSQLAQAKTITDTSPRQSHD